MELLPDPLQDRKVKSVPPPPAQCLRQDMMFPNGLSGLPDWECVIENFKNQGKISVDLCLQTIRRVASVFSCESNILSLADPVTVVGDIHGQFYDFVKLLQVGGDADKTQYLFLGDYVDRGSFAVEVVLSLFCLKINFPQKIWMLRGNHECRQMTSFFNFREECEHKYDMGVYGAFMDCFDTLPLCAVINGRFFGVHGGLSPQLTRKETVTAINRFQEPPRAGTFCDLLWADPVDEAKEAHMAHSEAFFPNDVRGCSFFFGFNAARVFLDENKLLSVIRAHEAQLEGYKMHRAHPTSHFPTVITIFSAPNYCDVYNNKAAVLKFSNNTLNIQQFNFSPHPYHLPNFLDVFLWSLPFIADKTGEIFQAILNPPGTAPPANGEISMEAEAMSSAEDLSLSNLTPATIQQMADWPSDVGQLLAILLQPTASAIVADSPQLLSPERAQTIRTKVLTVARVLRILHCIRSNSDLIDELKSLTPRAKIPPGVLVRGQAGLRRELQKFKSGAQAVA